MKEERNTEQEQEQEKRSKLDSAAQLATVGGGLAALGGVTQALMSSAKKGGETAEDVGQTLKSIRRKGLKVGPIPIKTGEQVARDKKARSIKKQRRGQTLEKQRRAKMDKWPKWRVALNKYKKLGGGKWLFEAVEQKKDAKALADFLFSDDWQEHLKQGKRIANKGKRIAKQGRFIGDTARDINEARQGIRTNKRRKRVWERRAVKDAAIGTAAIGTVALAQAIARKKGTTLKDVIQNIFSSREGLLELDNDWYTSRETGSSVRVHHKGRRRERRKKKWHERKGNRDAMWAATATALPIASVLAHRVGKNRTFTGLVRSGSIKSKSRRTKSSRYLTPDINEESIPRAFRGKELKVGGGWHKKKAKEKKAPKGE